MSEAARRRLSLQARRVCRFCLSAAEPLGDIYAAAGPVPLPLQVMACVAIEVFPTDGMPSTICNICRHFMDQSYKFKQICKQSDEALRQYISQGILQDPVQWPADMLMSIPANMKSEMSTANLARSLIEKNKKPVGRPRKQSNEAILSTIKAKKDECSIKITKRGDEVIVAATDDETKKTKYYMYQSEAEKSPPPVTPSVPTGVFPCPECERSFPLEQLRDIHAKTHLRERPFHCNICERSYYSKYDLQKHEETHTGIKSFACAVCDKKFLRLTLLQRHEKTHTLAPRYPCKECEKTFLSEEQLAQHAERHTKNRQFSCDLCPKKFAFKQGLERHYWHHTEEKPFKCDYCHQGFTSANRLARHVQSHAGGRPYPCKFCPKSFLLSHHYTRHLRTNHLTKTNGAKKVKSEGVFARQQDCYKCVQCDESFSKQDDLIFHSAIHATQDLTCPLCKEKFPDVDAVTTHIKSHIEGEQFICEWCELVFTSEEKLDMHIDLVHQEALGSDDQFNKISYLEGQLVNTLDEREPVEEEQEGGNSTDEEYDTLYESSQQAEEMNELAEAENKSTHSEIEVEVLADGEVSVKISDSQIENNECAESVIESEINIEDSNLTYTELKTVAPSEYVKPVQVIEKSVDTGKTLKNEIINPEEIKKELTASPPKKATPVETPKEKTDKSLIKIIPKEGEKKNFMQRLEEQKLKRANEAALRKNEMISETKSPTGSKSLMLLEKDIQELKRNAKSGNENMSSGRFLSATSTPKDVREKYTKFNRTVDSIKDKAPMRTMPPINRENKDDSLKREKIVTPIRRPGRPPKIAKEPEEEEDETESSMSDGDYSEGDVSLIRRSSRPNKVKDYAALIRDGDRQIGSDSEQEGEEDDDVDEDELEEKEYRPPPLIEKKIEVVPSGKRKRGRPRKNPIVEPAKKAKLESELSPGEKRPVGRPSNKFLKQRAAELGVSLEELKKQNRLAVMKKKNETQQKEKHENFSEYIDFDHSGQNFSTNRSLTQTPGALKKPPGVLVKTLPPGVKPVPLPPGVGVPPGVCQMKIGEKVVRVQKIVMTKAEVNAITKKGLIEMKDGAMILKAGVILPHNSDNKLIKNTLLSESFTDGEMTKSAAGTSHQSTSSSVTTSKDDQVPKPTRYGGNNSDDDEEN